MFRGWMYDLAREQSPSPSVLTKMFQRTAAAGYNAIALYLEHRFAYRSAPWAAGPGCLTEATIRAARQASGTSGDLRVIPFLNTLGHMEGFIRAEGGQWLEEGPPIGGVSVQMCASRPECHAFARGLVEDALAAFDDEWIHLGGDETRQLGQCAACSAQAAAVGKGGLYAEFYAPLCRQVLERGRRPGLWADMLLQHPEALDVLPRETLLFDWQYFQRPGDSTRRLRARGFDVVCCPSVQSWNSGWCFLDETYRNIDEHVADAAQAGALGVLVTTWNMTHFSTYEALLPIVYAAGRRISRAESWEAALAAAGGLEVVRAAEILGREVPECAAFLKAGTWRQLRDRLVMRLDPFALWQAWRMEAGSSVGDRILDLCDAADAVLPAEHPLRLPVQLHRAAVHWVRSVERAAAAYSAGEARRCVAALADGAAWLATLGPGLERVASGGGSMVDPARLARLLERVKAAAGRVSEISSFSSYTYRPSFETVIHPSFVWGDQAGWDAFGVR